MQHQGAAEDESDRERILRGRERVRGGDRDKREREKERERERERVDIERARDSKRVGEREMGRGTDRQTRQTRQTERERLGESGCCGDECVRACFGVRVKCVRDFSRNNLKNPPCDCHASWLRYEVHKVVTGCLTIQRGRDGSGPPGAEPSVTEQRAEIGICATRVTDPRLDACCGRK